ncbi:hypothetical protein [Burkholderia phage BCSR52]|uniref:Uncharacterized protein n=1 Tax=Burkholderia phage BCSR52 TaxID=2805748 RepID=A0A889IQ03_9CAUD|nr:hypothetical protein [Burkholderia phage BCSR52]
MNITIIILALCIALACIVCMLLIWQISRTEDQLTEAVKLLDAWRKAPEYGSLARDTRELLKKKTSHFIAFRLD